MSEADEDIAIGERYRSVPRTSLRRPRNLTSPDKSNRIECADPWLIATRAYGIVKFDVAAEVPDDRARQPDRILPLHAHATAARLIENVDPRLTEKRETHGNE